MHEILDSVMNLFLARPLRASPSPHPAPKFKILICQCQLCGAFRIVYRLSPGTVWGPSIGFCTTLALVKVSVHPRGQKSTEIMICAIWAPFEALRRQIWESNDFFALNCVRLQESCKTKRKEPKRYSESDIHPHSMRRVAGIGCSPLKPFRVRDGGGASPPK